MKNFSRVLRYAQGRQGIAPLVLILIVVGLLVIGGAGYVVYTQKAKVSQQQLVGNDRDSHGCIPSAGYSWCEVKQKCLRPFEEKCEAAGNVTTTVDTSDWQTYRNEQYGFEFQYPTNDNFKVTLGSNTIRIAPYILLTVYPDASILYSKDYQWKVAGPALINLQKDYSGYIEDLGAQNRSQCYSTGDCGPYYFNILKRKIDSVPAIDYRQNSVGGPDRSVIFEKNGVLFLMYHAAWYPLPFSLDEMQKRTDEFKNYQDFENILSTFKFITPEITATCEGFNEQVCLANANCAAYYRHLEAPPAGPSGYFANSVTYQKCVSKESYPTLNCNKIVNSFGKELCRDQTVL